MAGFITNGVTKILDFFGRRQATLPRSDQFKDGRDAAPMVSYAESPSLYVFEQFKVATDRISTIREVNQLMKTDLRFRVTNNRLAADATRGGFRVVVAGSDADRARLLKKGKTLKRLTPGANVAQQIIDDFLKRTKLQTKVREYARVLPRDGDLFLNPIVDLSAGLVQDVRRAPALTIKRNSDEFGEFPDIERAFSQIDPRTQINTLLEIGPPSMSRTDFALFQMNHIRWLEEETEMYGSSHYASARATHKILSRMEIAAAVRREFRSVMKYNHKLPETAQEKDVKEYMRLVGLIDENGNPTRNAHLLSDFVGTADVKVLDSDGHLDQMDDIKYFDDLLWLNLSVPKAILTAGRDLNRDILKVQYPHYLKTLEDLTDLIEYGDTGQFSGIRAIIDLQLLLAGINPDSIRYDVVWADKSDETATERMERAQQALGKGGGKKLITLEKAIQEVADDFDIEDPAEMAEQIEEEERQKQAEFGLPVPQKSAADQMPVQLKQEPTGPTEAVTDVVLEDRPEFGNVEEQAKGTVFRFFNAVYRGMLRSGPIMDAEGDGEDVDPVDEKEIMKAFDESWDANSGDYRIGIVRAMLQTGMLGAERAVQLVMDFESGKAIDPEAPKTGVKIKPKIVKKDIYDDLSSVAGKRITGIEDTTRTMIRGVLAKGFEQNAGWKEIMKQMQPVIVNPERAEMIARTELSWAYNRSAKNIYQDAGFVRVKWSAIIDQRTCPRCKGLNGHEFPLHAHPALPAHPRCRCTLLPEDSTSDKIKLRSTYSEPYKAKLEKAYDYFRENGFEMKEHALNRMMGHINKGSYSSLSDVLYTLKNGDTYVEPDGTVVKWNGKENISVHLAQDDYSVKSVVHRTEGVRPQWIKQNWE